ncbi:MULTISPECIES: hypothetical protein, partial [unclassified Microbispora]|uniref:hypothetical protein n=1 Tax=unclassified Microbispora TaxID=2614687 RepID=UPI00197B221B
MVALGNGGACGVGRLALAGPPLTGIATRTGTCLGLGSVELVGFGGRRVASVVGVGVVGAARS